MSSIPEIDIQTNDVVGYTTPHGTAYVHSDKCTWYTTFIPEDCPTGYRVFKMSHLHGVPATQIGVEWIHQSGIENGSHLGHSHVVTWGDVQLPNMSQSAAVPLFSWTGVNEYFKNNAIKGGADLTRFITLEEIHEYIYIPGLTFKECTVATPPGVEMFKYYDTWDSISCYHQVPPIIQAHCMAGNLEDKSFLSESKYYKILQNPEQILQDITHSYPTVTFNGHYFF